MTTDTVPDYTMAALDAIMVAQSESSDETDEMARLGYAQAYAILAVAHELRVINDTLSRKPANQTRSYP